MSTEAPDEVVGYERLPFPERGARRPDRTAALVEFYADESAALDEGRYDDWLAGLAPGFIYQVPVIMIDEDPSKPRHSDRALLFEATKHVLAMKLGRASDPAAWADRPGARTRHIVGGVRVFDTTTAAEYRVESNVIVSWHGAGGAAALATAGRVDVVRDLGDGERLLLRRRVLLDREVPTMMELSIIY